MGKLRMCVVFVVGDQVYLMKLSGVGHGTKHVRLYRFDSSLTRRVYLVLHRGFSFSIRTFSDCITHLY